MNLLYIWIIVPDVSPTDNFNVSDAFGQLIDDFVQTCNKKIDEAFYYVNLQAESQRNGCENMLKTSLNSAGNAINNSNFNVRTSTFDLRDIINIAYTY